MKLFIYIPFFLLSLLILPLNSSAKNNSIVWNIANIEETIGVGEEIGLTVTFVSNKNLTDIDLWVVPELQPFVNIEPNHFEKIDANVVYDVTISLTVPYDSFFGLYEGTIHLKTGSKTNPQTLKVKLDIVDAVTIIGPEGGTIISSNGMASVDIPIDAIAQDTNITITPVYDAPLGNIDTVYDFGSDGIAFSEPVTITLSYDPLNLPAGVDESELLLAFQVNENQWQLISNSTVDVSTNTVSGETVHFSKHAIIAPSLTATPIVPNFKLPLPENKNWLLTVEVGGDDLWGTVDPFHTDEKNGYYSLDFDNITEEDVQPLPEVPILAAGDGQVIDAGGTGTNFCDDTSTSSWGYTVVIDHDFPYDGTGYTTRYAHLKYLPTIPIGDVKQGAKVGVMGNTGSSCPTTSDGHLHFQIYYNGSSSAPTSESESELEGIYIDTLRIEKYEVGTFNPWVPIYYPSTNTLADAQSGDTWMTKASMPTARHLLTSSAVAGKIYVIGGQDSTGAIVGTVEEYDPSTDTWTTKSPMPTPRAILASSVVNGKIYAIGGDTVPGQISSRSNIVEEYDSVTDTWTTKSPMPTARSWATSSVVNRKIYVIGGSDSSGNPLSTVEEYDPSTDTWAAKSPMPSPRGGLTSSPANGKIYAIGGGNSTDLNTVAEYDPSTDTWTLKNFMPTPRSQLTASVINGKIYAIGGGNNTGFLDINEEYDPSTDTWAAKASMSTARQGLTSSSANGKIYAIGGGNNTGFLDINEEYR